MGIGNFLQKRLTLAAGLVVAIVVIGLGWYTMDQWVSIRGNSNAQYLASQVHIVMAQKGDYPDTDANHMVVVPVQSAWFEANTAISKAVNDKGENISTIFSPANPTLQSVDNHMYWIFELKFNGYRLANQANRIVPGYLVVDAEDPNAAPQVRLGYKMVYTLGAPTGNSLQRHIYNNGYRDWLVDNLTLEIRDDWTPFYTASLDKPALRYTGNVPKAMIVVDPQTGKITQYSLNDIPSWVDRVYSQQVAQEFMNWWGRWGNAPWQFIGETPANRTKVAYTPNLVYTTGGHPAWQILMTSKNSDTSVTAVVLFDGRSNTAQVYTDVAGIGTEPAALEAFRTSASNIKSLEPVHLSMHKLYGTLSWVVAYVAGPKSGSASNGSGSDSSGSAAAVPQSAPFQGVGILPVSSVDGANVAFSSSKAGALSEYRIWLANGTTNPNAEETGFKKQIQGTIKEVKTAVVGGNTVVYILLNNSPLLFHGAVADNQELLFAQPGIPVTITYLDVGTGEVDIAGYDDPRYDFINAITATSTAATSTATKN